MRHPRTAARAATHVTGSRPTFVNNRPAQTMNRAAKQRREEAA